MSELLIRDDDGNEYSLEGYTAHCKQLGRCEIGKHGEMRKAMNRMSKDLRKQCDETWVTIGGLDEFEAYGHTRAYASDGVWFHACGATYDEGRGDWEERGEPNCTCDLCEKLTTIGGGGG